MEPELPEGNRFSGKTVLERKCSGRGLSGLSVQDLLDPSYPAPIRQAIVRLEKLGYDVGGLWVEYISMKYHLKTNIKVFREL